MIYDLDYNEVTYIQSGEEYQVPCVRGLPVILPSHVDIGDAGPTGRHWHMDTRFPTDLARMEFDKRSNDYFDKKFGLVMPPRAATMTVLIMRDEGEDVVYEKRVAAYTIINASGKVFTTLIKLYNDLGTQPARNRKCVHHATVLQEDGTGCLTCPAHGLRFTEAGGPRYMAPFFLHVGPCRVPARTGDGIEFKYPDDMKPIIPTHVELRDSAGELVSDCLLVSCRIKGGDTLKVNLGPAWNPKEFCPSFRKDQ